MAEKVYQAVKDESGAGALLEVQLPEFVCHKRVRASKIVAVSYVQGIYRIALEGSAHVDVSKMWVQAKNPQPEGYFVQYGDGYSSYSPGTAFEEGYSSVPEAVGAFAESSTAIDDYEELRAKYNHALAVNADLLVSLQKTESMTALARQESAEEAVSLEQGIALGQRVLELEAEIRRLSAPSEVVFETKEYSDGSSAFGVAPLPDLSPAQQDAASEPGPTGLAPEQQAAEPDVTVALQQAVDADGGKDGQAEGEGQA